MCRITDFVSKQKIVWFVAVLSFYLFSKREKGLKSVDCFTGYPWENELHSLPHATRAVYVSFSPQEGP